MQANKYTKHKGIQRLLENTAFQRFKHALSKAVSEDALAFVTQNFDDSQFISAHAAQEQNSLLKLAINKGAYTLVTKLLQNNEVYDQCGLNELYLALRTSSHPGIIRKLLTIPQIHKTLLTFGDLETIEIALNSVADAEDAKMIWSTVVKRPIGQLESIGAPRTVDDLEINNHVLADKSLLSELPEKLFCLQDMNEAVAFAIEHEDEEYSDVASEEANLLILDPQVFCDAYGLP